MHVAAMHRRQGRRTAANDSEDFEWVNVWAQQCADATRSSIAGPLCNSAPLDVPLLRDVLAADAARAADAVDADIATDGDLRRNLRPAEGGRDALLTQPAERLPPYAGWVPLRRTADTVPVILGSVLGALMVIVFSAAAMFARLAR